MQCICTKQMLGEEELLLQSGKENTIIDAGVDILKMTAENGDLYTADGEFDEEKYREIWQRYLCITL